jgi:hypothetical protein
LRHLNRAQLDPAWASREVLIESSSHDRCGAGRGTSGNCYPICLGKNPQLGHLNLVLRLTEQSCHRQPWISMQDLMLFECLEKLYLPRLSTDFRQSSLNLSFWLARQSRTAPRPALRLILAQSFCASLRQAPRF